MPQNLRQTKITVGASPPGKKKILDPRMQLLADVALV